MVLTRSIVYLFWYLFTFFLILSFPVNICFSLAGKCHSSYLPYSQFLSFIYSAVIYFLFLHAFGRLCLLCSLPLVSTPSILPYSNIFNQIQPHTLSYSTYTLEYSAKHNLVPLASTPPIFPQSIIFNQAQPFRRPCTFHPCHLHLSSTFPLVYSTNQPFFVSTSPSRHLHMAIPFPTAYSVKRNPFSAPVFPFPVISAFSSSFHPKYSTKTLLTSYTSPSKVSALLSTPSFVPLSFQLIPLTSICMARPHLHLS